MKVKALVSLIGGGAIIALSSLTVFAANTGRAANIKSYGVINIENGSNQVYIDSADLRALANEIDCLELTYKEQLLSAIQALPDVATQSGLSNVTDATALSYSDLVSAVRSSQVANAIADNLSLGKTAWVNGVKLTGNGADVDAAYQSGYTDGFAHSVSSARITYTYHVHTNGSGTVVTASSIISGANPGGCYVAAGHTHISSCPTEAYYGSCSGSLHIVSEPDGSVYDECISCGARYTRGSEPHCYKTVRKTRYTCGDPTNTWKIGCGKTTSTIETATITYS